MQKNIGSSVYKALSLTSRRLGSGGICYLNNSADWVHICWYKEADDRGSEMK